MGSYARPHGRIGHEHGFPHHIGESEHPRIQGMVFYPLDEISLTVLVGLLCRTENFDEIVEFCAERLDWLRQFAPPAPHGSLSLIRNGLD